jgi:hypothetical protein
MSTLANLRISSRLSLPAIGFACTMLGGLVSEAAFATPFQQLKSGTCTGTGVCSTTFAIVPAGRRLDVTNESCFFFSSNGAILAVEFATLNSAQTKVMSDFGVPVNTGKNPAGASIAMLNNQTRYSVAAGRKVVAIMTARDAGNLELDCKIAGDLITP